jgi:Ca2+-binding EF-hand superfamily protein
VPDTATLLKGRRDAQKLSAEEAAIVADVEERIRLRTKQRGIYMLAQFIVYDKTRLQRITKNQFTRVMLSLGFELTKPQVKALAKKYCNLGNADDFNYRDFCDVVDPTRPDLA